MMISQLSGKIIEKQAPQIIIDVNGIGYEVEVSMQTFYLLPEAGETIRLYTQLMIREDAHLLFGFADKNERSLFRQLIKVSGIGAKIALGILSAMTPEELEQAIAQEDTKQLSRAPGIGKKTAERMILELRGKLVTTPVNNIQTSVNSNNHQDIISTLIALGYTEKEAQNAVKSLDSSIDISEGVRQALKNLTR